MQFSGSYDYLDMKYNWIFCPNNPTEYYNLSVQFPSEPASAFIISTLHDIQPHVFDATLHSHCSD